MAFVTPGAELPTEQHGTAIDAQEVGRSDRVKDPQIEFDDTIRRLGSLLHRAAREQMGRNDWEAAKLDVRISQNGRNQAAKFRIKLGTETVAKTHPPDEIDRYIDRMWELRPKVLANNWHGFLATVSRDGRCEVTFNYDPDCKNDPTFYDD